MRRLGTVVTLVTVALAATFVTVVAYNGYLSSFNSRYGTADGILDTCTTCHGGGYSLNAYGADFLAEFNNLNNANAALAAIEMLDSDGDGDTNILEIEARTFPGNGSSNLPVEGATWGKIKILYE